MVLKKYLLHNIEKKNFYTKNYLKKRLLKIKE